LNNIVYYSQLIKLGKFKRCTLDPIVVKNTNEALKILPNIVNNDDVVLTLGAGDIHTLIGLLTNAKP
jgi:UDP-N-acetylmuramate-alanine ligase